MESKDESTKDGFFLIGSYSPHEAAKLLGRFEKDGIVFRAQPVRHSYYPRMTVAISVDLQRAGDADKIHQELFGDGLPNYDSSFFRGHAMSNHTLELTASRRYAHF
jgi:hypothetical protein